jgi:hypothetical protein
MEARVPASAVNLSGQYAFDSTTTEKADVFGSVEEGRPWLKEKL